MKTPIFHPVTEQAARADGVATRTYSSGAFACPYDGPVPVTLPQRLTERMFQAGSDEVAIADTIGAGNPRQMKDIMAPLIRDFVPEEEIVSYLEACLRVYNRYGRRDNKYKARIKILVHEMGAEEYTRQVEAEYAHLLEEGVEPPFAELERIRTYFEDPLFEAGAPEEVDRSDPDFAVWVDRNTVAHKEAGYVSAVISLKPVGGIPGDATAEQMRLMADLAKDYSFDELRVMHTQNIVLPHVRKADLHALWTALDEAGLGSPNLDTVEDIIACPGLDYCSLANARSIPIAQRISERFAANGKTGTLGELKLKISGCINACGHHHAGHIGILGVDRKGVENYQLLLGGSEAEDVSLAKITGPGFDENGIVDAVAARGLLAPGIAQLHQIGDAVLVVDHRLAAHFGGVRGQHRHHQRPFQHRQHRVAPDVPGVQRVKRRAQRRLGLDRRGHPVLDQIGQHRKQHEPAHE